MEDFKNDYDRINALGRKSKEYYLTGIHARNTFHNICHAFSHKDAECYDMSWCKHVILELERCTKLCFYSLMYLHRDGAVEMTSLVAMYDNLGGDGADVPEKLACSYEGLYLPKGILRFEDFNKFVKKWRLREPSLGEVSYGREMVGVRECLLSLDLYVSLANSNSFVESDVLNYWGVRRLADFVGALLHFYGMTDKQLLPQNQYWRRSLGFFLELVDFSEILIHFADISTVTNLAYLKYRVLIEALVEDIPAPVIEPVVETVWLGKSHAKKKQQEGACSFSYNGSVGLSCFLPKSVAVKYCADSNGSAGVIFDKVYKANRSGFHFLARSLGESWRDFARTIPMGEKTENLRAF